MRWGVRQGDNVLYFEDADAFCVADLGLSRRMDASGTVALTEAVYALLLRPGLA